MRISLSCLKYRALTTSDDNRESMYLFASFTTTASSVPWALIDSISNVSIAPSPLNGIIIGVTNPMNNRIKICIATAVLCVVCFLFWLVAMSPGILWYGIMTVGLGVLSCVMAKNESNKAIKNRSKLIEETKKKIEDKKHEISVLDEQRERELDKI